jgi:hypothetical protein
MKMELSFVNAAMLILKDVAKPEEIMKKMVNLFNNSVDNTK